MDDPHPVTPVYHLLTPGDHFSPRTGSAVPTVVHALASAAHAEGDTVRFPQRVIVGERTFTPRYGSAEVLGFTDAPAPARVGRLADIIRGAAGDRRRAQERYLAPAVRRIDSEPRGLLVAHNAPVAVRLAARGHRVVLYAHNSLFRTYTRNEAGRALRDVAAIVCVSDDLADETASRLPRSLRGRIRTVWNGADTTSFSPRTGDRDRGAMRVIFVGRMIAEKGADILLEAASRPGGDGIEYTIVGSAGFDPRAAVTPFERRLRTAAERVDARVEFLPFVDRSQLPQLLAAADVLVVPSRWREPSSLTAPEGMASGLAVAAARVGGIPEVVGDAGALFDPNRPDELAAILHRWKADPDERSRVARAGLVRAGERDWGWAWRRFRSVLEEIVGDDT